MSLAIKRLLFMSMLLIMATTSCSDRADDYYNRGNAEKATGDLNSAERDYAKALNIKPDYAEAHNDLGFVLLQKGRLDEAILHFQKALQIKPDYAEAHDNLGNALLQKGKVDDAVAQFQQALAINPGDATVREDLDKARLSKEQIISEADIPVGKLGYVTSKGFGYAGKISVISGHHRTTTLAYTTRELEFLPDGKRIIYCASDSQARGIYIYDLTQHTNIPLMPNIERGGDPSWSPDGTTVAFVVWPEGRKSSQIYTAQTDGSHRMQLTEGQYFNWTPRWSPDGQKLVFETTRNDNPDTHVAGGYRDIYVMDGNGQNQINLTKTSYGHHPSWSPDGKSIAYMSHGENGHSCIFVMKDDGSAKQNISKGSTRDSEPVWSPDGQWIAFTRTANNPPAAETMDIWIMKSDGTEQRQETFNQTNFTSYSPSWGK